MSVPDPVSTQMSDPDPVSTQMLDPDPVSTQMLDADLGFFSNVGYKFGFMEGRIRNRLKPSRVRNPALKYTYPPQH